MVASWLGPFAAAVQSLMGRSDCVGKQIFQHKYCLKTIRLMFSSIQVKISFAHLNERKWIQSELHMICDEIRS